MKRDKFQFPEAQTFALQRVDESPDALLNRFIQSEVYTNDYGPMGWPPFPAYLDNMQENIFLQTIQILQSDIEDFPF